jgi:hypothetical protein
MGALDDFLSSGQPETRDKAFKIAPEVQQKRDQGRMQILQGELDQNTTDLNSPDADTRRRAQANIEMIRREMGGSKQSSKPAQSTSALDDFLNQSQELGPPVKVESSGGVKAASIPQMPPTQTPQEPTGVRTRGGVPVKDTSDVFTGAMGGLARTIGGAARGAVTSALGAPGDINKLIVENIGSAFPTAPAAPTTEEIQKALPGQPTTQEGKVAQQLGAFLPVPLIPKVPSGAKAALETQFAEKVAPVARIEPTMEAGVKPAVAKVQPAANQPIMAGVGAARTADAATLAEATARATPELKAELSKVKPGDVNVDALNRVMDADQLPVPVRLTRGQATQDPVIISNERNQRGIKDQVAAHLNEQNKALQENANLMKERVAPDVNTTSFVEDAERSIDLMNKRIKADDEAITSAYNSLKDYGAGKLQVDSQSFGNNAMKALSEFDEQEFLPSSILKRVKDYTEGKPMNFNQFENLRTVLANETRMAQSANNGNAVHALTVVRSELEKMPLLNETAEAKVLADKARSLAKSQFDLLDKKRDTYNPLYAEVMNGIADTKDFIPKLVFRSKNKDFVKTIETLGESDPQAIQHLRSGALDYMIRESTDASGNFLTGKFNKLVDNLDVNKKLDALFGEDAKTIRAIASTGKIVEARPKGSFVNESNTAVAAAQMAKQYGAELLKNIPGVKYFVEPASQVLQQRQIAKEVKQTIKPAAGVRLSDIGKKK